MSALLPLASLLQVISPNGFEMLLTSSSVQLPASKGFTVRVSILLAGRIVAPAAMIVQPPIAGHDIMDITIYSFLIESEAAGKKMLYDLGIMKAWEEKQPPHSEFLRPHRLYSLSLFLDS
jgi:hypothetical protein